MIEQTIKPVIQDIIKGIIFSKGEEPTPTPGSITIDSLTYTRGTAGIAPVLSSSVSSSGSLTANFTLYWATRSTGTPLSKSDIENGTGDALENGTMTASTLDALDGSIDLSTSLSNGAIDAFIRDSSGSPNESNVASATGVTYDAAAPAFSSAEVGNVDSTTVVVTFDKAIYGTTSVADWAVVVDSVGVTESASVISGSTVEITLSTAVGAGSIVTVAYSGTGIVGVDAEQVAAFTAQSVTNNVSSDIAPQPWYNTANWTGLGGGQTIVGTVLQHDGTNAQNENAYFINSIIPDDTATYEITLTVGRFVAGGRYRLVGSTNAGSTVPNRIPSSTFTISGSGTYGGTFTVPSGATDLTIQFFCIDANLNFDIEDVVIEKL